MPNNGYEDHGEDGAITSRLRTLETFRAVSDERFRRIEADRDADRKITADQHREISIQLGSLKVDVQNLRDVLGDRVDTKIESALEHVRSDMQKMHADNKEVGKTRDESQERLAERILKIEKHMYWIAGAFAVLSVVLKYVPSIPTP